AGPGRACNSGRPGRQRRVGETLCGLAAEIEGSAFRVSPKKTREMRRFGEQKMVGDLADVQIGVGQQALGLKDDPLTNELSRILPQARRYRRTQVIGRDGQASGVFVNSALRRETLPDELFKTINQR